jgi:hypothetical protein
MIWISLIFLLFGLIIGFCIGKINPKSDSCENYRWLVDSENVKIQRTSDY